MAGNGQMDGDVCQCPHWKNLGEETDLENFIFVCLFRGMRGAVYAFCLFFFH